MVLSNSLNNRHKPHKDPCALSLCSFTRRIFHPNQLSLPAGFQERDIFFLFLVLDDVLPDFLSHWSPKEMITSVSPVQDVHELLLAAALGQLHHLLQQLNQQVGELLVKIEDCLLKVFAARQVIDVFFHNLRTKAISSMVVSRGQVKNNWRHVALSSIKSVSNEKSKLQPIILEKFTLHFSLARFWIFFATLLTREATGFCCLSAAFSVPCRVAVLVNRWDCASTLVLLFSLCKNKFHIFLMPVTKTHTFCFQNTFVVGFKTSSWTKDANVKKV